MNPVRESVRQRLPATVARLRLAAVVSVAALACASFTYLTPPLFPASALAKLPVVGGLSPDRGFYWLRFGASALFLGILPLLTLLLLKMRPSDAGLRLPSAGTRATFGSWWFLAALAAAPLVGALGALSPGLGSYYPYSRSLIAMAGGHGIWPVAGHLAAYFFLYYLPWEFFFRGFLIFPLLRADGGTATIDPAPAPALAPGILAAVVLLQTIPSTLLHIGHPFTELASAIPAGLAFGMLAWRTKSILPGLLIHAAIGFGTDVTIILRALAAGGAGQ